MSLLTNLPQSIQYVGRGVEGRESGEGRQERLKTERKEWRREERKEETKIVNRGRMEEGWE